MANNSQTSLKTQMPKENPLNFLEEGRVVEWLSNNGKYVAYVLIGLLVLFIVFYRYSSTSAQKAEKDYMQAYNDFTAFSKPQNQIDETKIDAILQNLLALMQKHPELHAAYDGTIAQTLLNQGKVQEALPLAEATLKRAQMDELPYYTDFGKTTLIIEQKDYTLALEKAQALQTRMNTSLTESALPNQRPFDEELFAINLFRIAMLKQLLNDKAGELATWQLWKQYAGLESSQIALPAKINPQAFRSVIQHLAIGSISLPDYISYRENELKNNK